MATLTLTVAAAGDDLAVSDTNETGATMQVGGVSNTPGVGFGQGWRFTSVTLTSADTVNAATMKLMKSGTQWSGQDCRWTAQDVDNASGFTTSSPNRPGDPAIVSASIAAEVLDRNELADTVYDFPSTAGLQATLGAAVEAVVNRAGWSSGNALAIVNNSDQDASAVQNFGRKLFQTYDSTTASSEPQLVLDYTAGAGATFTPRLALLGVG